MAETLEGPLSDEKLAGEGLVCFVIGPIGNRLAAVGTPEKSQYETSALSQNSERPEWQAL